MKHCPRGHRLPDECWCPDDPDEDDKQDEGCGEDGPVIGVVIGVPVVCQPGMVAIGVAPNASAIGPWGATTAAVVVTAPTVRTPAATVATR